MPREFLLRADRIHAVDRAGPAVVEAILVRNGRVAALGTTAEVRLASGAGAPVIELPGATVIPGLADAHAHLLGLGSRLATLDLAEAGSEEDATRRAREWAERLPSGAWLIGRGWNQESWERREFPGAESLSREIPDRPAFLIRVDGHAAWVNRRALEDAAIDRQTPDPPGGRILRDPGGDPTGILVDAAMDFVRRRVPPPSIREREERLRSAARRCAEVGLTAVHDMGVDAPTLEALRRLARSGDFPLHVVAYLLDGEMDWESELLRGDRGDPEQVLAVRGVKFYLDGALGSRGAALLEPYEDDAGNHGLLLTPPEDLLGRFQRATRAGGQIAVHAIGDRACRIALDLLEECHRRGDAPLRPRIEHLQVLDPSDRPRLRGLRLVASVQPVHCASDSAWVRSRIGARRAGSAYPLRSARDAGAVLAFGSDFPIEDPDPRPGLYAAVTRRRPDGSPPGGFGPGEAISAREALEAFTGGAAWAAGQENLRGSISAGRIADFTVFDRDPLSCEAEEILRARILWTVSRGRITHRDPAAPDLP